MNSGWYMYTVIKCIVFPSCTDPMPSVFLTLVMSQMLLWGRQGEGKTQWLLPRHRVPDLSAARRKVVIVWQVTFDIPFTGLRVRLCEIAPYALSFLKAPGVWGPSSPGLCPGNSLTLPALSESHLKNCQGPLYLWQFCPLIYVYKGSFISTIFFHKVFPFSHKISCSVPVSYLTHQLSITCFE